MPKISQLVVSWELFLDRRVMNFLIPANQILLWFLELFELLGTSTVRMPLETPCCCLDNCLHQDAEQHRVFGKGNEDKLVDHGRIDVE